MIIKNFDQLSNEWFEAHAYSPSASQFDRIITTTGKASTQRKKYLYQLAGERLIGRKEETYQNADMLRGIEMEPEARITYEFISGFEVEQVGLIYKDERYSCLCSPDGIVNEYGFYGGLEIKCPRIATHMEYLCDGKLPTQYFQQVQGSLYITGFEWWDFVSYFPELPTLIVRVEPDLKWHEMFETEINKFNAELDEITERLRNEQLYPRRTK